MSALTQKAVYLITNDAPFTELMIKLEQAFSSPVVQLLQYRRKQVTASKQQQEAVEIEKLCRAYGVKLIINDRMDLAGQLNCGVHLGQGDGEIATARQQLGQDAMIGRTCHGSLVLAQQAIDEGADYVAFGAFFHSGSKPEANLVSPDLLVRARAFTDRPLCAIGGLTVENIAPLIETGCNYYAVIGDILNRPTHQIAARVMQWQQRLMPHQLSH